MKTLANISFLLFSIILILNSCTSTEEFDEDGQVIIAGKISNHEKYPDNYTVKVFINEFGTSSNKTHIAYLDKDGNFILKFKKHHPQDIYLQYGKLMTLFISPGDSLYLSLNADEFLNSDFKEGIKFTGDAKLINENMRIFLNGIKKVFKDNFEEKYETTYEEKLAPNEYKYHITSLRKKNELYLKGFIETYKPSQLFINWAHFYINYGYGVRLLHYVWYHPFINKLGKPGEQIAVPERYYSYLDKIPLDNKSAFISTQYHRFLHEHYMAFYYHNSQLYIKNRKQGRKFTKSKQFQAEFRKYLSGLIKKYTGFAQQHLISVQLYNLLYDYERIDVFEKLYPKYKLLLDEHFRNILQKKYTETKLAEKNQENSIVFKKDTDSNKSEQITVFQQVLEKHKRKVIYIDVLATWCGPCLQEIPFSKKLQEEFQGKDVAFVYFCVKSKKAKWESIISDYKIEGDKYLLNDSEYDILSEEFQILGIPRYILVNKKGIVVDKNAQRPSFNKEVNNELIEEINTLIRD